MSDTMTAAMRWHAAKGGGDPDVPVPVPSPQLASVAEVHAQTLATQLEIKRAEKRRARLLTFKRAEEG